MTELFQSLCQVQSHIDYDTFRFTITDFLEAEKMAFNESELTLYGAQAIGGGFVNARLTVGIVTRDPDLLDLLKTRYEPLVSYCVGYFPTLKECQKWIEEKTATTVQFQQ